MFSSQQFVYQHGKCIALVEDNSKFKIRTLKKIHFVITQEENSISRFCGMNTDQKDGKKNLNYFAITCTLLICEKFLFLSFWESAWIVVEKNEKQISCIKDIKFSLSLSLSRIFIHLEPLFYFIIRPSLPPNEYWAAILYIGVDRPIRMLHILCRSKFFIHFAHVQPPSLPLNDEESLFLLSRS